MYIYLYFFLRLLSKNAPVNDRNNTFESVMNILGNLGPEDNDLILLVTQPLIQAFHVSCVFIDFRHT